jgi:hypothetical protein
VESNILQRVYNAFYRARLALGRQNAREKIEAERQRAAIELALDDIAAEGIDPRSPLGLTMLLEMAQERLRKVARVAAEEESRQRNGDWPEGY